MAESAPSNDDTSLETSRAQRFLDWQELTGHPVQLGPGVYEPSVPSTPTAGSEAQSGQSARCIRFIRDGDFYDVIFDEA